MELLPVANTNDTSADFVVAVGQMPTIFLKDALGSLAGREVDYGVGNNAHVHLQIKADGQYFTVATLDAGRKDQRGVSLAAGVIAGSGTFRVLRTAGRIAVGVEMS